MGIPTLGTPHSALDFKVQTLLTPFSVCSAYSFTVS